MKRKTVYLSDTIHGELKALANDLGRKINMNLADDIVAIGIAELKRQKKFNQNIHSVV